MLTGVVKRAALAGLQRSGMRVVDVGLVRLLAAPLAGDRLGHVAVVDGDNLVAAIRYLRVRACGRSASAHAHVCAAVELVAVVQVPRGGCLAEAAQRERRTG